MLQSPGPRSRFAENPTRSPSSALHKGVPGRGSPMTSQLSPRSHDSYRRKEHQMGESGGELSNSEKLHVTEEERDRALGDGELQELRKALPNAKLELKIKERGMKSEAERAKKLEAKLAEKDALLNNFREEVKILKTTNKPRTPMDFRGRRISDLEEELERRNEAEIKLLDALAAKTKQLEETKSSLEESKLVISSLSEKMEKGLFEGRVRDSGMSPMSDDEECLRSELILMKENLDLAEESEKVASLKIESLVDELNSVRNELKLVTEVEENGKKAMDDLAFALKEVATEANEVKEQLGTTKRELEKSKSEAVQYKFLLKSMENRCRTLLEEARKEVEKHKNTSERLRLEAEESLLAWHEKETMFVECIKNAEEENSILQKENDRMIDALTHAQNKIDTSKEENKKLRDILKQALNEASVAKEAAAIAREENSQLKDNAAETESALEILCQEIENLRMNESLLNDNVKELKKLLQQPEPSQNGIEHSKDPRIPSGKESNIKKLGRNCSLDLNNDRDGADSPGGEGPSPNRKKSLSLSFAEDASMTTESFEQQDEGAEQESEGERSARKKKPALFKRFGSMLMRRSMQKKEAT